MHIKDVKTAFKIADVVLNKKHPKNHIKFNYVENLVDESCVRQDYFKKESWFCLYKSIWDDKLFSWRAINNYFVRFFYVITVFVFSV